jgi:sugar phosphate isomerase/epimerase
MRLSFTTLGCPAWGLDKIIERGAEYGFDGVDFRGIGEQIDITQLPEFKGGLSQTASRFSGAGLAISGISSSIRICVPEKMGDNIEEARRTIPVAAGLGCTNVRVFGAGDESLSREALADIGRDCMEQILAIDGAEGLNWVFETHDAWIKATDCRLLLDRIPNPAFGALWDMGHTARVGGESPAASCAALAGRIGYTHVKDAVYDKAHPQAMQDGWRYVPPGTGQLPLAEAIGLLAEQSYDGWIMFEHEKRWHPELEEPEQILPEFLAWARPLVG